MRMVWPWTWGMRVYHKSTMVRRDDDSVIYRLSQLWFPYSSSLIHIPLGGWEVKESRVWVVGSLPRNPQQSQYPYRKTDIYALQWVNVIHGNWESVPDRRSESTKVCFPLTCVRTKLLLYNGQENYKSVSNLWHRAPETDFSYQDVNQTEACWCSNSVDIKYK